MPSLFNKAAARVARWVCCCLSVLLGATPAVAQEMSETGRALTVDDLVQRALTDNPELRALHAEWAATLEAAEGARHVMPQPRVNYTAYLLAVETRQGPQRHMVSLSQAFPWVRALRDAADPMVEQAAATAARFDAAALRLVFEVETAALRVARAEALAALMHRQREVYADVADHLAAVMPFGGAEHGDVLRTSLMVEVFGDRIADIEAARDTELATLRALVRVGHPESFDFVADPLPVGAPELPIAAELAAQMAARHPAFEAFAAEARAELERAEVEANRVLPMPSLSVGWGVIGRYDTPLPGTGDGGQDVLMVGFSMPLPLYRRQYRHAETSRLIRSEAAAERADDLAWTWRGQIERALVRIDEESARLERYDRDLLPIASDATDHYGLEIAHRASNHTDYLLAFEQELQLRVTVVDARFEMAVELARLNMLTAGYIDELAGREDAAPSVAVDTYGDAS